MAMENKEMETAPTGYGGEARTAGQLLRHLREQAGIEVEALASALKVAPQKIQALESDNMSLLPDTVFARGLASNICRYLKTDAQPVLTKMAADKPRIATDDEALNAPFSPRRFGASGGRNGLPAGAMLAIAALLLAALVLFLLPTISAKWGGKLAALTTAASERLAEAKPSAQTAQVADVPAAQTPASAASVAQEVTDAGQKSSVHIGAPAYEPQVVAPAEVSAASAAALPQSNDLLFKASGDVWVQIRNANGKTIFERTMQAGSEQRVPVAAYPVRVTIGRAENVQLTDRGNPFDLSAIAKTGVARFELK